MVDAGEASLVFSRRRLPDVLRFGSRSDQLTALCVSRHFASVVQRLPEHKTIFREQIMAAFSGDATPAPQWTLLQAEDAPLATFASMRRDCHALQKREARDRRVRLQLPVDVIQNIEAWKRDVVQAAEELGQRCFMRWDLIDQVRNPEEIVYTFRFVAGNVLFKAENKAASRIGVTSSFCKMWLRVDVPEITSADGSPHPDKSSSDANGNDGDYEGKKESHLKTIAQIEGDTFDAYCSWRKSTAPLHDVVMPSGTFDGSIQFTCLPGLGSEGNASVKFHRL
eukprot:g2189.t1